MVDKLKRNLLSNRSYYLNRIQCALNQSYKRCRLKKTNLLRQRRKLKIRIKIIPFLRIIMLEVSLLVWLIKKLELLRFKKRKAEIKR